MEKHVTFKGWALPLLLIAPQVAVSAVFFFYPAGQAVWQSLFIPDPFRLSMIYVGLGNFEFLLSDPFYRTSFVTTAVFSILVTLVSMILALFLAVIADRLVKGAGAVHLALCIRSGGGWGAVVFHVQYPRGRDRVVSGSVGL